MADRAYNYFLLRRKKRLMGTSGGEPDFSFSIREPRDTAALVVTVTGAGSGNPLTWGSGNALVWGAGNRLVWGT